MAELQADFAAAARRALAGGACCDTAQGLLDGGVLCVSLPRCAERRAHTARELAAWGFPAPRFVDALCPDDLQVLEWYNSPRVAKYPPCFRCGNIMTCYCPNNVMLIEQVANWLSFRKAWQAILSGPHEWYLLVEDDVKFTHRAGHCWGTLMTRQLLEGCAGAPCIVRCGWQLGWDYVDELPPELAEGAIRMSNHCSVLNRSMAEVLLRESEGLLDSTSDLFIHERVAPRHRNFTLFPPISYDLSFALQVPSLIRPKGVEGDDPAHVDAVRKAVRVTPRNTRAWLCSLTWAPRPAAGRRGGAAAVVPRPVALHLADSKAVEHWADLDPAARGEAVPEAMVGDADFTFELRGDYVVRDPEPPPAWVYAARRLFVGDPAQRPRGFLPVGAGGI